MSGPEQFKPQVATDTTAEQARATLSEAALQDYAKQHRNQTDYSKFLVKEGVSPEIASVINFAMHDFEHSPDGTAGRMALDESLRQDAPGTYDAIGKLIHHLHIDTHNAIMTGDVSNMHSQLNRVVKVTDNIGKVYSDRIKGMMS